jgi:predicted amidohydrolase YtcJ
MRTSLKWLLFFASLLCILFIYLKQDFKKTPPTLYKNGHIVTLNDQQPIVEAMYVVDGKIIELGTTKDLEKSISKDVALIDLKGSTVLPGFIDPHTHFSISMFLSEMHNLSGFKFNSNRDVWNEFERIVKETEKGEWIICKGLDPILVDDLIPPSITYLDSIAPDNPVLFFSQSLHNYWANSKAFDAVGIHKATPNPSEHSYYGKDDNGELNGVIVEQEAIKPFFDILKSEVLTPKVLSKAAARVMSNYVNNGNTTIVSAGITIQDDKPLMLFKHLSNDTPSLLSTFLEKINYFPKRQQWPRHFMYMRHDTPHLIPEKKDSSDFYGIIGVKHWYDGSPYTGSMYLHDNYLNSELANEKLQIPKDNKGEALITKNKLKTFIKKYHQKDWQIAIHTQGDAATNDVIDTFKDLENELDFSESRHRLEHCLLLQQKNLNRMKVLNLTPSLHINHLYYYGDALKDDLLGKQRAEHILPLRSIKEHELNYSIHADQPMFESNPFRLIQTAVERKTRSGNILGKTQNLTVLEAIKSLTIDAAWQIHMEDKIGSLEKGKYADFVVLNKNPFTIQTDKLSTITCLKTVINGNVTN